MSVIPAVLGESPACHVAGTPYSPLYDDVYQAVAGGWAQAQHVFLSGNGLPGRWQGKRRFVVLETGFGLGNNFLTTWDSWLQDPARCDQLIFISIENHPLRREDLARVHGLLADASLEAAPDGIRDGTQRELARQLVEAWPPLTPGLHTLRFDHAKGQGITLMLGLGDIADLLPSLVARVDAFYLDGFAPDKNPQMWDTHLLSRLNRLAAPGCTAATWSSAPGVRDALTQAGFQVELLPGFAGKKRMVAAVYEPRFTPPLLAGGCWPEPVDAQDRYAIVIGAGLAGCSTAQALCREGWRVTLIDQHGGPAQEASGNPGGLFHSVLHGDDGLHARALRAAALATWRRAQKWIASGQLLGQADGLLRLDDKTTTDAAHALLLKLGMPPDHVQWLDQAEAHARSGLNVPSGGWLFHQAGWLHPAGFARLMLDEAAACRSAEGQPLLTCQWHQPVTSLRQSDDGQWQVLANDGVIAQAPALVLCNALASQTLLGTLPPDMAVDAIPLSAARGQITAHDLAVKHPDHRLPKLPVAGAGYALSLNKQTLLCGATNQLEDTDTAVREADHRHNLNQAARLGAGPAYAPDAPMPAGLQGRTAWRATTPDRLPLIGALPLSLERLQALPTTGRPKRLDQVRLIPRQRTERGGLYALTGLGSRGITWSCLAADLLAHWVTGSPCPVEADLRDALDPARFLVRQVTKGG
jgi:tRNA 5-methylaminomethyl-2-thiouridine biosynthesis bifunctional protein